ncbi:hypothetical protein E4T52_10118 [Aureobasidium sp. EXF-3400]|nr:hypothetical protein E4T51_13948 [Aureobasidium sp. EXF-12344]KAI4774932.1 hypothetical protein E4T52_10118 [Aureobasidium sp. EXF-3400]
MCTSCYASILRSYVALVSSPSCMQVQKARPKRCALKPTGSNCLAYCCSLVLFEALSCFLSLPVLPSRGQAIAHNTCLRLRDRTLAEAPDNSLDTAASVAPASKPAAYCLRGAWSVPRLPCLIANEAGECTPTPFDCAYCVCQI